MISTIKFEHGEKTCAVEPGKFCLWLGTMGFGTKPVCRLFENEPLQDKDGWLQRCKQCVKEFGETKCEGWNPSEEVSPVLSMTRAQLSQQIGEMTAQEWRTVQAVFQLIKESK